MGSQSLLSEIPVIDLGVAGPEVARQIDRACRQCGFFYLVNHGVDERLPAQLETLSRRFFALPLSEKMQIPMARGGRAWRGYFPVGGELTSGQPDWKEGLYFGRELEATHPKVVAGVPLHGPNLFPPSIPQMRETVLTYLEAMTTLGHTLLSAMAGGLGLEADYFYQNYTSDPLILFRIFNYPAGGAGWGVGEHTDYGVLTILKQDDCGGLEVKTRTGWISAPPLPGAFVVNLGDMLDRMTGGHYRSTLHRVKNTSGRSRLSFPFFFDPGFDREVKALPLKASPLPDDRTDRWDGASVHEFRGTYGDYLLKKVSKVFPALKAEVLP